MNDYPIIDINLYPEGSPERTLANYLEAWRKSQWGEMFEATQLTWKNDNKIDKLKQLCSGFRLLGAEIKGHRGIPTLSNTVAQDIIATIHYKFPLWTKRGANKVYTKDIVVRLICETEPYQASPEGRWGVNPISALRSA